jgi:hypothetical protein
MTRTTAEVIARFNQAFANHDPALLADLVGSDCVMEAIQPAPDGARTEGRDECLAFWEALATDDASLFEPENVVVAGERATILWRYRFGDALAESVRGVTLVHVVDGRIVEALGYSKTGEVPLAAETKHDAPPGAATPAAPRTTQDVLERYNGLFEKDLVDEMELLTIPVVIGQGARLFADSGRDIAMNLIDSRTDSRGSDDSDVSARWPARVRDLLIDRTRNDSLHRRCHFDRSRRTRLQL